MNATLRSAGAVLAGLVTVVVLSTATDAVLHATGVFPPMGRPMAGGLWVLATAYRFVFTFLGGWVTARLAPEPRMRAVWILTGIGAALGLVGVLSTLGAGPELGPLWYPVAVAVTGPIASWWGGRTLARRAR
jgi:hypothetical protein